MLIMTKYACRVFPCALRGEALQSNSCSEYQRRSAPARILHMALDFQQVRQQVLQLGERARLREQRLEDLREQARRLLEQYSNDLSTVRQKVELIAGGYDPSLRCAMPFEEHLATRVAPPPMPGSLTILAADGSQIAPDRHAEVEYCLINVGAVEMHCGSQQAARTHVSSQLLYAEDMETPAGLITEAILSLKRDLAERAVLAQLVARLSDEQPSSPGTRVSPVVTFTDGRMELWGAQERDIEGQSEYQKSLQAYTRVLEQLADCGAITAGYIDKPSGIPVVRMLELMLIPPDQLGEVRRRRPLSGVRDTDLFRNLLEPGERSAVFALQSAAAKTYTGRLGLHFFYLNVGRPGHPWLGRVELPAWVAESPQMVATLHAVLLQQCRAMGARPFPYLLHRAHEVAVVPMQEKEQVTQMIALELRRQGVSPAEGSAKQFAKTGLRRTKHR